MATPKALLQELEKRRAEVRAGGGEDKLKARRDKGVMAARDRVTELFQAGTFQESGMHADHDCHNFGMEKKSLAADAVVTGTGIVDGRLVASFSQDFTVAGGSLGRIHARKICDLMDYALKVGCPIVGFNDSGGARIQEGDDSLSGYGQVFFRNVLVSGVIPQIAIIAGPCAGGAA
jgi:propionyl-CoA carboxylase beta chain